MASLDTIITGDTAKQHEGEEVVFNLCYRISYAGINRIRFKGISVIFGVSATCAAPPAV
jgi:hypothetical protein